MLELKKLSPEHLQKIKKYKEEARKIYQGIPFERESSVEYIEFLYSKINKKKPIILFAKDPREFTHFNAIMSNIESLPKLYDLKNSNSSKKTDKLDIDRHKFNREFDNEIIKELYSELGDRINTTLYNNLCKEIEETSVDGKTADSHALWFSITYNRGYLAFYHFINNVLGVPYSNQKQLDYMYNLFNKCDIARCFFAEGYVIVLRNPYDIKFKESMLHNVSGPSFKYRSGKINAYHVNGRRVPKEFIEGNITKEMILQEENEDLKAAMVTIVKERDGDKALLDLLEAEVIDERKIQHFDGYEEIVRLYKTKEKYEILQDRHGNMNQPYCWSEMVCPSTGQTYLIENSADFNNAEEAIKWLRPSWIPQELKYTWQEFAN